MLLLVVGGTGYLGQAICRAAVQRGVQVTSLSRRGEAPTRYWAGDVSWQKGDVLQPATWDHLLESADCVVHAVGTLLENTGYKQWKTAGSAGAGEQTTYERMNRDTAVALVHAAASHQGIKKLLYISAASAPPLVDMRYISTKRAAEQAVLGMPRAHGLVFRPGFIYDQASPASRVAACAIAAAAPLARLAEPLVPRNRMPARPLSVQTVAAAAVESLLDDAVPGGIYEVPGIESLAAHSHSHAGHTP